MKSKTIKRWKDPLGFKNKLLRFIWNSVWVVFVRPIPRRMGGRWRVFLLRSFGAKIHSTAVIYSSVTIYMPWKLEMHEYSCLAPKVDCYNVDKVSIGAYTTVSQKAYLCTASHDISQPHHPLITAPIIIEDRAWVAAEAFIGMGVTIHQGAVVGARAAVFKNVPSWTVVGGNPASFIKKRKIEE